MIAAFGWSAIAAPPSELDPRSARCHKPGQLCEVVDGAQLPFRDEAVDALAIFVAEQHNDVARRCATSAVGPVKFSSQRVHLGEVERQLAFPAALARPRGDLTD